jgi:hypothetical protein
MAHVVNSTLDRVKDEEMLFRCVFFGRNLYKVQPDGVVRLSSQAFADQNTEPSVDRAVLCNNDPSWTQKDEQDGVVSLITIDVRRVSVSGQNPKPARDEPIEIQYNIDVVPDPFQDNEAHAVVRPTPPYQTKSVFRRVREALARIAEGYGWVIPPADLRSV